MLQFCTHEVTPASASPQYTVNRRCAWGQAVDRQIADFERDIAIRKCRRSSRLIQSAQPAIPGTRESENTRLTSRGNPHICPMF